MLRRLLTAACAATLAVLSGAAARAESPGPRHEKVYLDGSSSRDPGGAKLKYSWRQVAGRPVELKDASTARPWFIPKAYGTYEFELRVSNGAEWSRPAVSRVIINPDNRRPRADAGEDIVARLGDTVLLDGGLSSDPDGNKITYLWRQLSGPGAGLPAKGVPRRKLSFTARKAGTCVFELVVSDGKLDSETSTMTITVTDGKTPKPVAATGGDIVVRGDRFRRSRLRNAPPVARADGAGIIKLGQAASFDGATSSDPDGDRMRFFWIQRAGPTIRSLKTEEGGAKVTFTPTEPGEYAFELTVSDGLLDSAPLRMRLRVHEGAAPVVADAGEDVIAIVGQPVRLDGTGSGTAKKLNFSWKQASGPRVRSFHFADLQSAATPEFVPEIPGIYIFELTVSDRTDSSEPDRVRVIVSPRNRSPVLTAPELLRARRGEKVSLNATASDPEGRDLAWNWKQVSGPRKILRRGDRDMPNPTVRPPRDGKYLFEVTVTDGESAPARALVALVAGAEIETDAPEPDGAPAASVSPLPDDGRRAPVAICRTPRLRTRIGEVIALDALGSFDPAGGKLSYRWRQIEGGSLGIPASELSGERLGLRFWRTGTWGFELIVESGGRRSDPARVTVVVEK